MGDEPAKNFGHFPVRIPVTDKDVQPPVRLGLPVPGVENGSRAGPGETNRARLTIFRCAG